MILLLFYFYPSYFCASVNVHNILNKAVFMILILGDNNSEGGGDLVVA